MNGPDHYTEAERLIELADAMTDPTQIEGGWETTTDPTELDTRRYLMKSARREAALYIAQAQVHATLALAAVQLSAASIAGYAANLDDSADFFADWMRVTS